MSALTLEINRQFAPNDRPFRSGNATVMITPPLDEDYWLARVPLGNNAVVCFPKFGIIGIGFQKETDWNTNLPSGCAAEDIWSHVAHNAGDASITPEQGIAAIRLLQEYAKSLREPA